MEGKVRKIGNSLGVILPKHLIDTLHLKKGDRLTIDQKEGAIELRPIDPEFEEFAEAYGKVNETYRDVLDALAK